MVKKISGQDTAHTQHEIVKKSHFRKLNNSEQACTFEITK